VRGPDRGGPPAKTVRAQKLSLMLCHAFPAEILRASRTAGNRCPVRMGQASLKSEVHRETLVKNQRGEINHRLPRQLEAESVLLAGR
jgi:hypothetical protein